MQYQGTERRRCYTYLFCQQRIKFVLPVTAINKHTVTNLQIIHSVHTLCSGITWTKSDRNFVNWKRGTYIVHRSVWREPQLKPRVRCSEVKLLAGHSDRILLCQSVSLATGAPLIFTKHSLCQSSLSSYGAGRFKVWKVGVTCGRGGSAALRGAWLHL